MEISYLGHSCFKLKGKAATVVMDPFFKGVGFSMPATAADIITISHDHSDHNNDKAVTGTSRRAEPYVISAPGEYEVSGVGVFGWGTVHDKKDGAERGKNTMYVVHVDGVRVCHLGDLGRMLTEKELENIGEVDMLLVPVGGVFTIDASEACEVVKAIQPSLVIPMHYKTDKHSEEMFAGVSGVEVFLKEMGEEQIEAVEKLKVEREELPENTEVVLLRS